MSTDGQILLAFKAGRAFRREGTNYIDPEPTKGAILLVKGDDDLVHFQWKNRVNNIIEEDLILFPSDATFVKVSSPTGRVYVLKFSSSNQRHFFWLQDASSARDEEFANNLNGYLEDPDYEVTWSTQAVSSTSTAGPSSWVSITPSLDWTPIPHRQPSQFQPSQDQIAEFSRILASAAGGAGAASASQGPEFSLSDILTPANLLPLFSSHPTLIPALFPHLPPDLPVPPSADVLGQIIHSPQFRAAVTNFDQALRTGLLGGLVRTLGLPEEAGTGLAPFLRAVQEQADRERQTDDRMEE